MEVPADESEILAKLKHHRENILLLLYREGELPTREIGEQTQVPSGSRNHHLTILTDWGLIEEIGRTTQSGGIPERIFGLTDQGREFVEEYLTDDEERPDSHQLRLERVESEIDTLEQTIDHLEDVVDKQAAMIDDLQDTKLDETRFDTLTQELEDYRKEINRKVENRTEQ